MEDGFVLARGVPRDCIHGHLRPGERIQILLKEYLGVEGKEIRPGARGKGKVEESRRPKSLRDLFPEDQRQNRPRVSGPFEATPLM